MKDTRIKFLATLTASALLFAPLSSAVFAKTVTKKPITHVTVKAVKHKAKKQPVKKEQKAVKKAVKQTVQSWKRAYIAVLTAKMPLPELIQYGTPYLPVWYVDEALHYAGGTANMAVPVREWQFGSAYVNPLFAKFPHLSSGTFNVVINGSKTAMKLHTIVAKDPWSHKNTRYIDVNDVSNVIYSLGFTGKWSGDVWDLSSPYAKSLPPMNVYMGTTGQSNSNNWYYVQGYSSLQYAGMGGGQMESQNLSPYSGYMIDSMGIPNGLGTSSGWALSGNNSLTTESGAQKTYNPSSTAMLNVYSVSSMPRWIVTTTSGATIVVGDTWYATLATGQSSNGGSYNTSMVTTHQMFQTGNPNNYVTLPPTYESAGQDTEYGTPLLTIISNNGFQYQFDPSAYTLKSETPAPQNASSIDSITPFYDVAFSASTSS